VSSNVGTLGIGIDDFVRECRGGLPPMPMAPPEGRSRTACPKRILTSSYSRTVCTWKTVVEDALPWTCLASTLRSERPIYALLLVKPRCRGFFGQGMAPPSTSGRRCIWSGSTLLGGELDLTPANVIANFQSADAVFVSERPAEHLWLLLFIRRNSNLTLSSTTARRTAMLR
jgi:hypothetical protein